MLLMVVPAFYNFDPNTSRGYYDQGNQVKYGMFATTVDSRYN